MVIGSRELAGKKVFSQDGTEVGAVLGVDIDLSEWAVKTLEVRLERDVLEKLNLSKPMFGSQTVRIGVERIAGVSDTIVLRSTLKEIAFVDSSAGKDEE